MLSVLSSGSLHLSEELSRTRAEIDRLRGENADLQDVITRHYKNIDASFASCWRVLRRTSDGLVKKAAFLALRDARNLRKFWRRDTAQLKQGGTIWLYRRKVVNLWRKAVQKERCELLESKCQTEFQTRCHEVSKLQMSLECEQQRRSTLEDKLVVEQQQCGELQDNLAKLKAQIVDLQATLKDSFVRQFEETQRRRQWEERASQLEEEVAVIRAERDSFRDRLSSTSEELQRSEARKAHCEARLFEASGELTMADELLGDMRGAKWSGLTRFFEKYDMPAVTVALFRKVLEQQEQIQRFQSRVGSQKALDSPTPITSSTSLTSLGSTSLGGPNSQHSQLEEVLRRQVCVHNPKALSRVELQSFVDSLRLGTVSSGMVAQVLSLLLGMDLGRKVCEVSEFSKALAKPPHWNNLDVALDLWGADPVSVEKATAYRAATGSYSKRPLVHSPEKVANGLAGHRSPRSYSNGISGRTSSGIVRSPRGARIETADGGQRSSSRKPGKHEGPTLIQPAWVMK